jgi:adenosylhomocysteine nucleosidase
MPASYEHVGVIGALDEEVARLREHLDVDRTVRIARRHYDTGQLGSQRITLVQSRMGKVAAAITATTLIQEFGVDAIIFTGVAGALVVELDVGDIVVATSLVQHDLQATPGEFERGEVPLLGITELPTDPALTEAASVASRNFLTTGLADVISKIELNNLGVNQPTAHRGCIATGDEFIHGHLKAIVRERAPLAVCVDMESAAVAQVCYEHDELPLCVIRAISDRATGDAPIEFPKFRDALAQHYSYEILRRMFESDI